MLTSRTSQIIVAGFVIAAALVTLALLTRPAAPAASPDKSPAAGAFNPGLYFPLPPGKRAPHGSAADLYLKQHGGASAAQPIPGFPVGKFIKQDTDRYGLYFAADGTFIVFDGHNTLWRGTYGADGHTLTVHFSDSSCPAPIKFNYSFDGTNLTFSYQGDASADAACSEHYADFNNEAYVLVK